MRFHWPDYKQTCNILNHLYIQCILQIDFTPVEANLQSQRHRIKCSQLCDVLRELYVKSQNTNHDRSAISYWAQHSHEKLGARLDEH